jgi:hypothetical protein
MLEKSRRAESVASKKIILGRLERPHKYARNPKIRGSSMHQRLPSVEQQASDKTPKDREMRGLRQRA